MRLSAQGLDFIKAQEGFRMTVYLDVAGNPTAGTGHLLTPEEQVQYPVGSQVPEMVALAWLESDVAGAEEAVNRLVTVPLSQSQFDALVDFCFNLGGGALQRSTLLADLNEGRYHSAAAQIPLWDHAGGRVVQGLQDRRLAEQRLFLQESA